MGIKYWLVCSSSSGKTFESVFSNLQEQWKTKCLGLFADRECEAINRAKRLIGEGGTFHFGRKQDFETNLLKFLVPYASEEGLIFLCGFFGILSKEFLEKCPWPVVNTHPSLLPAFPGLDEKVHQKAFQEVHYSGFTVHLVNESLDGGPILYQEPVNICSANSWQEARDLVRGVETARLPKILENLFLRNLRATDRYKNTRDLINS